MWFHSVALGTLSFLQQICWLHKNGGGINKVKKKKNIFQIIKLNLYIYLKSFFIFYTLLYIVMYI